MSRLRMAVIISAGWAVFAIPISLLMAHFGEPQARWIWSLFGVQP